jgi:uncharacterized protein YyaL (SSP411 family)
MPGKEHAMAEAANLLRHETSPYLLQHKENPVHWRPWGRAALDEAATLDKPILLSIGYAACHWCHVMAHESFEDPETAALMNRLFINIKVDREERPDIDQLYMSALHALGEQGGWPMTMFLTPDGTPFWGGTYFPPEPRWGRPSFRQVLEAIAAAYRSGHKMVGQNTTALRQMLERAGAAQTGDLPTPAQLDAVANAYLRMNDLENGGLKGAPKFPNAPIFRFLWQNAFRTGQQEGRDALHLMLQRMSQGGIHDHLGGGYARYATDAIWLVPHFEKMLYDNAQILELLAFAHADHPNSLYAQRAAETAGWMIRDMSAQVVNGQCAFAASEDADSEGEEGKFYVWSEAGIDSLLGADSALFKQAYDVTPEGNWEGKTILHRVTPEGTAEEEARLAHCREILLQARARRVRPGRDDKVLADWNGLAIAALARGASVFDKPEWLAKAGEAFRFIANNMRLEDGRVQHAWRLGRITAAGLIEDQAALARAALALHEATGAPDYLAATLRIVAAAEALFSDGGGGFYTTSSDAADVPLTRPRSAADDATPAGNGMMAEVYGRLFYLTGDAAWRSKAEGVLRAFAGDTERLAMMPGLLSAADFLEEAATAVIAGDPQNETSRALVNAALLAPDPAVVVLRAANPDTLPADHPAYGKHAGAAPAAFLCRRNVCGLPTTDPAALAAALRTRDA